MQSLLVNWKTTSAGAIVIALALFEMLTGVKIPGFSMDPGTAMAVGLGLLMAKDGNVTGAGAGARAVALAALAVMGLSSAAMAADLTYKGQPKDPFPAYPVAGCGAFYGINTMGAAQAIAGGPVGGQIVQGDVGLTLGYTCTVNADLNFWFVEGNLDWANLNGTQNGFSLTGPAHFQERFAFGGPISKMLNLFPNMNLPAVPSLPILPPGVTSGPGAGYVFFALDEQDISASFGFASNRAWMISPGVGAGMLFRLSNNVVADVSAMYKLQSNAVCLGGGIDVCPALGQGVQVGFALKY